MTDVIDRAPPLDTTPPELPPFLRGRGRGRGRYVIIPDITRVTLVTRIPHDNVNTLIFHWMVRIDTETGGMERAHIAMRRYRQWLETYETETGIPPHVAFGGAIEPVPGGDPDFHKRWVEYAKLTYC